MDPNPKIISQSQELETDKSLLKIFFLGVLAALFSFSAIYSFNQFLLTSRFGYLGWSLVTSTGFLVMVILEVLFIKSLAKLNLLIFLQSVAPLLVFSARLFPKPSYLLLSGAGIFFLLLMMITSQGVRLIANSVKIRFFGLADIILPKAVTALLVFMSVILYLNYFEWGKFNDRLGQASVDQILILSKPIVRFWFGDFSFNQSAGDFLKIISESQLKNLKPELIGSQIEELDLNFDRLSPQAKNVLIEQSAKELRITLEKKLGPIDLKEPINELVYHRIKDYINNLPVKSKSSLGFTIVLLIFLTIKGIVPIFYWLIGSIAFIVFKLLLLSGFAYITLESRSREFILLR